jgi:hypothetical protein
VKEPYASANDVNIERYGSALGVLWPARGDGNEHRYKLLDRRDRPSAGCATIGL